MADNEKFVNDMEHTSGEMQKISGSGNAEFVLGSDFTDDQLKKKKTNTKLSKTDKDARDEARFRNIQFKQPFDESGTPPQEMDSVEVSICDKYMEKFLDNLFNI